MQTLFGIILGGLVYFLLKGTLYVVADVLFEHFPIVAVLLVILCIMGPWRAGCGCLLIILLFLWLLLL